MDWASLVKGLSEAGGWAVAVGTWVAIGVGLVRKWWVPGWIHEERIAELKAVNSALQKTLDDTLKDLADDVRWNFRERRDAGRLGRGRDA